MQNAIHFIGFKNRRAFEVSAVLIGKPDFVHPVWDVRAAQEIAPGDLAVFAPDAFGKEPSPYAFDDSAVDVIAFEIEIGERDAKGSLL